MKLYFAASQALKDLTGSSAFPLKIVHEIEKANKNCLVCQRKYFGSFKCFCVWKLSLQCLLSPLS